MKNGVLLSAVLPSGCATVHTQTVIPAPPAEVWSELMNGPDYGEWHPTFKPSLQRLVSFTSLPK